MGTDKLQRSCTVVLHDNSVSREDVLCGSSVLPTNILARVHARGKAFYFVTKSAARVEDQLSIHVSLAVRFGFENRTKSTVEVVEDEVAATATHVELFFRDQHLSRADMWRMMQALDRTVIYQGQKVRYMDAVAAEVQAVYIHGREVDSAYVTQATTKPIFRSGTARYTILIQVSKEMLEYWINGELMYERLINGYLRDLFGRWEAAKLRHYVTVVLFGRKSIRNVAGSDDFFRVVVSEHASSGWKDIVRKLKQAFNTGTLPSSVSLAASGNMNEALHMAAMDFANDNLDPILSSRGRSIIAVTAGAGVFETEHDLLQATTQLLMGNSIGVDIVALSPKPLHPAPLFSYQQNGVREFGLPHWVDVSYWTSSSQGYRTAWLLPEALSDVSDVAVPTLPRGFCGSSDMPTAAKMLAFDDVVFGKTTSEVSSILEKQADAAGSTGTITAVPPPAPPVVFSETEKEPINDPRPISASSASRDIASRAKRDGLPAHSLMGTGRKISLGPKGLALSRSVASTTVSTQHAQHDKEILSSTHFSPDEGSSGIARQIRQSLARKPSQQSLSSQSSTLLPEVSQPISIQSGAHRHDSEGAATVAALERNVLATVSESQLAESAGLSETPRAKKDPFYPAMQAAEQEGNWTASPWVTLLNPCNPKRENMRVAAQYRKWQHVFPRAVSSSTFKWTSMCTPAALPLTTEYKPTMKELETHFAKKVHRILFPRDATTSFSGINAFLEQMIVLRLVYGFQISYVEQRSASYDRTEATDRLLLSLGNSHHELQCLSDAEIQVVEYELDTSAEDKMMDSKEDPHCLARVRTAHAQKAAAVDIMLSPMKIKPDWSRLDDGLVTQDVSSADKAAFRMRFNMIPVDPPKQGHATPGPAKGLSDEERRLEGIHKLTQLWQKNRYYTPDSQRQMASVAHAKAKAMMERDPNPLAIEYYTDRDPSTLVNAYGPVLTGQLDDIEHAAPLFAESELYHSSTFDVPKLIKQMQEPPPRGVEMRDRRWFARLHFRCFRGDEMVNWLLRVFKDLSYREDAITIGSELMKRGAFTHVRHKHDFRDGNYFYQIASAYRTTEYPDNSSMFKNPLRSVPATPLAETRGSPMMRPVRDDSSSSSGRPTPVLASADRKQLLLSDQLLLNVDPQKKSNQLEIINLHYDRIHNPENCYHIQLEWVNATSMLVRDAISSWARLAENNGFKLVQLPLTEVCKWSSQHAFDQPIPVKLAVRPPDAVPATPKLDAKSFFRPHLDDPLAYQKAVLRKLDFVLDFEAAASFTSKLDVRYSYGEPDYDLTQFVHRSGLVLAQVTGEERCDFLLLPNRLACQKLSMSAKATETASSEQIISSFASFCQDQNALKAFYEDVKKPAVLQSPFPGAVDVDADIPPIALPPRLAHRAALKGV